MICFVNNGQIFDRSGNEILPDVNGIVVLQVDNKPRRFVKEKLIDWLKRNNKIIPPPKIKKPAPPPKEKMVPAKKIKRERPKKYTIHNVRKVRTDFTRKGFSVIAIKDGITYGPFISITKLSKAINVSKSQISKVLRGEATTTTGFQFLKA